MKALVKLRRKEGKLARKLVIFGNQNARIECHRQFLYVQKNCWPKGPSEVHICARVFRHLLVRFHLYKAHFHFIEPFRVTADQRRLLTSHQETVQTSAPWEARLRVTTSRTLFGRGISMDFPWLDLPVLHLPHEPTDPWRVVQGPTYSLYNLRTIDFLPKMPKTSKIAKQAHFEIFPKKKHAPCTFWWGIQNWSWFINQTATENILA